MHAVYMRRIPWIACTRFVASWRGPRTTGVAEPCHQALRWEQAPDGNGSASKGERMKRVRAVALVGIGIAVLAGCDLWLFGPDFSREPISGQGLDPWTFASGSVEPGTEPGEWTVELYASDRDDYIMFTAPSGSEPRELQLRFLFDTDNNQTVTYVAEGTNYILSNGWLLLDVNETIGQATVKLHVWGESVSFNGTVTIPLVP